MTLTNNHHQDLEHANPENFANTMPTNVVDNTQDDVPLNVTETPEPEETVHATGDAVVMADAVHHLAEAFMALAASISAHAEATSRLAAAENKFGDEMGLPSSLDQRTLG